MFHNNKNLMVVGDLMLDKYWIGNVDKVSPEAPVPIFKNYIIDNRAGGAANVAKNIASLGGSVSLFGMVGKDREGKELIDLLCSKNIKNFITKFDNLKTSVKLRLLSKNQQLLRVDKEENSFSYDSIILNKNFLKAIKSTDLIILSDYSKGVLSNATEIIKIAKSYKKIIIVDPKSDSFDKYKGATVLTPNLPEFERVVGYCKDNLDISRKAKKLIKNLNFNYIIVTKGSDGLSVIPKIGRSLHLKSKTKDVFDVTGAGDTLTATLGLSMANGLEIFEAAKIANYAAGIVVGKIGTSTVEIDEMKDIEFFNKLNNFKSNSYSYLFNMIENQKNNGKTIVFTNGCFDILHLGHIHLLNEAKKLGDILVVGVNSDSSVKKIKGNNRPINTLKHRIKFLKNLKSVDFVIPFKDTTPVQIIKKIVPNTLVKGGDYFEKDVLGGDIVKNHGGKVVIIDYLKGFSSTKIINKEKYFK